MYHIRNGNINVKNHVLPLATNPNGLQLFQDIPRLTIYIQFVVFFIPNRFLQNGNGSYLTPL